MSKPDKHIENWIQEKYETGSHAMEDAYLQNMSAQLDAFNQKKKKRRFLWLFFFGLGSIGLIGSLTYGLYLKSHKKQQQELISSEKENTSKIVEENCEESESIDLATSSSQLEKINSDLEETKQSNLSNQNIVQANQNSTLMISKNSSINSKVSLSENGSFTQKEKTDKPFTKNGKALINFKGINQAFLAQNQAKKEKAEEIKVDSLKIDAAFTNIVSSVNTSETLKENNGTNQDSVSSDNIGLLNTLLKQDSLQKDSASSEKKQEKTKAKGTWSLVVQAGPDALFRNYESSTQIEKRTTEEKNKISGSIHLELRKTFANKIFIGSGFRYTNYGEKIAYSPIETKFIDSIPNVAAYDYFNLNIQSTPQGIQFDTTSIVYLDTTLIVLDSIYENKSIQAANGKTSYHFIEIPLYLGYTFFEKNAWSLSANTGFSVGFLVKNKGSYLQTNNELATADNKKMNFHYLISAQVNYTIHNKWSLNISPQFKYPLNNQSTLPATQRKYIVGGIQAGFQYKF